MDESSFAIGYFIGFVVAITMVFVVELLRAYRSRRKE